MRVWAQYGTDLLTAFVLSMLPLFELRGGMIWASARDVPLWVAAIACYAGNLLPIPLILLCLRRVFQFMERFPKLGRIVRWLERKARRGYARADRWKEFGLFVLVAVPLVGTGAWMGALIAVVFGMRLRRALPLIAAGVLGSLIIMSTLAYGFPELFQLLFHAKK